MKVLSISDVITNSSSEVFIIHSKPEFQDEINQEIPELIRNLCESIDLDIDEMMEFSISDFSGINEGWEYYQHKNDLIIDSVSDNTIPYWLMEFIDSLYCFPKFRDKFSGYYAKDLGEKEIPHYNWNTSEKELRKEEIESVQRHHLG